MLFVFDLSCFVAAQMFKLELTVLCSVLYESSPAEFIFNIVDAVFRAPDKSG